MSKRAPTYCRYRKKYARVKIEGQWVHLGPHGSEESHAKYKRLVAQWATQERVDETEADVVTVAEVLAAYRVWAQRYYGDLPRGRYRNLRPTIRAVRELYADLPAEEFSPKKLKLLRQTFIERGNSRTHANAWTKRVVAIFRWAAEEEMVPGSVPHALQAVRPLEKGRCQVREGKPVKAVDQEADKTLYTVCRDSPTLRAMRVTGVPSCFSCRIIRSWSWVTFFGTPF